MVAIEPVQSSRKVTAGSERNFGITFAVIFLIIGLFPMMYGRPVRWWALLLAAAFATAAFLIRRGLRPLNRLWFRVGIILHCITNPIIMGLVYYIAVVPMAILMRALGKDLLRLKREPSAPSYWLRSEAPDPPQGSMTKQF